MMSGGSLLIDEISLADDSVLERLNSVLEPERKLLLAERVNDGIDKESLEIAAHPDFSVFATMNPGGDFGKKEVPVFICRCCFIYNCAELCVHLCVNFQCCRCLIPVHSCVLLFFTSCVCACMWCWKHNL